MGKRVKSAWHLMELIIDADEDWLISSSPALPTLVLNHVTLIGSYRFGEITLQDPSFEQYATAADKPKALLALLALGAGDGSFARADGSVEVVRSTFSDVMYGLCSNTKSNLLVIAVLAKANRTLKVLLDYLHANRDDRTRDISVDSVRGNSWTPLFEAARIGNWEAFELLIQAGASLTFKFASGSVCPWIRLLMHPDAVDVWNQYMDRWDQLKTVDGTELRIREQLILNTKWTTGLEPSDKDGYPLADVLPLSGTDFQPIAEVIGRWATAHQAVVSSETKSEPGSR
jgi:hypothetical protein